MFNGISASHILVAHPHKHQMLLTDSLFALPKSLSSSTQQLLEMSHSNDSMAVVGFTGLAFEVALETQIMIRAHSTLVSWSNQGESLASIAKHVKVDFLVGTFVCVDLVKGMLVVDTFGIALPTQIIV